MTCLDTAHCRYRTSRIQYICITCTRPCQFCCRLGAWHQCMLSNNLGSRAQHAMPMFDRRLCPQIPRRAVWRPGCREEGASLREMSGTQRPFARHAQLPAEQQDTARKTSFLISHADAVPSWVAFDLLERTTTARSDEWRGRTGSCLWVLLL